MIANNVNIPKKAMRTPKMKRTLSFFKKLIMAVLRFLAVVVVVFFLFRFVDFAIYKSSHRFAINPMKNRSWIGKFITKVIKRNLDGKLYGFIKKRNDRFCVGLSFLLAK